jgi:uncharacterized protein YutE (UPF0331/DUF86 family)
MVEGGIISPQYYQVLLKMMNLKNKLISTWDIDLESLYKELMELKDNFEPVLKEISSSLKSLLDKIASHQKQLQQNSRGQERDQRE